ncbi:mechanosensitive ion channel family protein [Lewinella cohaerens]|uniref:mechanosensitive ion channel family protein n=1 Tax=Lewinella cohaerens TaxID=70995 RepID=UPI000365279F|nr:mechanosensitive ion channel [Lewinella cohaerens]
MQNWMQQFNNSFNNLTEKLEGWVNSIVVAVPNLILAAIVLAIGIFLARYVNKYVQKIITRFSDNRSVNSLISSVFTAVFVLMVIMIVLSILQLDTALQSLLAGAGVAGLAIGLALQDPIVNLFSGIMMSTKRSFHLGDLVESNDFFGTIKSINLRSTVIETLQGQEVIIPNKITYQNPFKNYSTNNRRRIDLSCGVSYGDDLEKVRDLAIKTIERSVTITKGSEVELFFNEFGSSSINFTLLFWIDDYRQKNYLKAQSDAIIAIKKAFDENDIMIPFPIRTLDFGIKGGEKIADALPREVTAGRINNHR